MRLLTLPLRGRRLIGVLILGLGVLLVLGGFFLDLSGTVDPTRQITLGGRASVPGQGSVTAAAALQHVIDHGLAGGGGRIATLADFGFRGGVVLMAIAGLVALIALVAPPLRGFAGTAAGFGLAGDALVAGVLVGERTRLTFDGAAPQLHVDVGTAVAILAAGFAVVLVGGAVAAFRPLAGLFSGISLAVSGAVAGGALALLVGGDRIEGGLIG
jgi:hypothetical protein